MAEFGLADVGYIVGAVLVGGLSIILAGVLWHGRATIFAVLGAIGRRYFTVSLAAIADDRSDDARNVHSEALERPWIDAVPEMPERSEWTREELVTFLAGIRLIGADGIAAPIAKAKISAAAGLRAEDAAELIRAARGQPNPAQPPKRTIPHRVNGEERLMEVDW